MQKNILTNQWTLTIFLKKKQNKWSRSDLPLFWQIDWLIDWMTDKLSDWLTDWLTGLLLTDWMTDWLNTKFLVNSHPFSPSLRQKNLGIASGHGWLIFDFFDTKNFFGQSLRHPFSPSVRQKKLGIASGHGWLIFDFFDAQR